MNAGIQIFKRKRKVIRYLIALACVLVLLPGNTSLLARAAPNTSSTDTVAIAPDQLDALVAPIALYPDSLLSQTLVASTYPLEIIQLQQWLEKNKALKGKALEEAVQK